MFTFSSAAFAWNLVLDFATVLTGTSSGPDELIVGAGSLGSYTGSYEECVSSTVACGGFAFQSVRFVTAGEAILPEPASLAILGFAAAALFGALRFSRRAA